MKIRRGKGFTLLEVLFAIAILLPVFFAILGVNFYMARATDSARMTTTAIQDAHTVIERMRDASRQELNQVTTNFPDGQTLVGFTNLTNEQIVVDYANPNADPLSATVTVTWTDNGRNMQRNLATQITQR